MSRPLPGAWMQWIAERLCAPETCQRFLLPIVADLQFEWQQASTPARRRAVHLRGALAFARAFLPALVAGTVHHVRRSAWGASPAERHASNRLMARIGLASLAASAALLAYPAYLALRKDLLDVLPLIVPGVVSVALPMGCLLSVVLLPNASHQRRWPLLRAAGLVSLVVFAVAGWLTPQTNQAYRQRILPRLVPELTSMPPPGDRELTFTELGRRAAELRASGQALRAARADVEWHKKPALAASCLALALAGLALSVRVGSRPLRVVLALFLLAAQFGGMQLAERAADAGRLAPALAMWSGVTLLAGGALLGLLGSRGGDVSIGA